MLLFILDLFLIYWLAGLVFVLLGIIFISECRRILYKQNILFGTFLVLFAGFIAIPKLILGIVRRFSHGSKTDDEV